MLITLKAKEIELKVAEFCRCDLGKRVYQSICSQNYSELCVNKLGAPRKPVLI